MVVLGGARVPCVCLPHHHHTRLPSHHHHQRSCATTTLTHTHRTWCMHHCHTHTPHAPPHTKACCVLTTPCHTHHHPLHPPIHTHTTWHTHTASATLPQWCLPSLTTPSTHTQLMPHTHHTGDRPRPSTPLAVAFREPPPPRWSCPFALLSSLLLVHQPLLSLKHALTRPSCAHHHHHAIHPVCVCCGDGQHQAPQWW